MSIVNHPVASALPPGEIQVRVPDIHRLFNPMDPSPTRQKDLAPGVEEFIVSWGGDFSRKAPLSLIVRVDQGSHESETGEVADAIHAYFTEHTALRERRLRQLFRIGRTSLGIGVVFLIASTVTGNFLNSSDSGFNRAIGGALEIGGWVAMWRPLSIFLYDWWPIMADIRLFRRLAEMPVKVVLHDGVGS